MNIYVFNVHIQYTMYIHIQSYTIITLMPWSITPPKIDDHFKITFLLEKLHGGTFFRSKERHRYSRVFCQLPPCHFSSNEDNIKLKGGFRPRYGPRISNF